eukprot:jgi/Tetstr1/433549/TSEL_022817.t1
MARPGRDSDDDTVELDMPEEDQRASSADGVGEERSGLMPGNLTQRVTSKRVLIWAAVCGSLLIAAGHWVWRRLWHPLLAKGVMAGVCGLDSGCMQGTDRK